MMHYRHTRALSDSEVRHTALSVFSLIIRWWSSKCFQDYDQSLGLSNLATYYHPILADCSLARRPPCSAVPQRPCSTPSSLSCRAASPASSQVCVCVLILLRCRITDCVSVKLCKTLTLTHSRSCFPCPPFVGGSSKLDTAGTQAILRAVLEEYR